MKKLKNEDIYFKVRDEEYYEKTKRLLEQIIFIINSYNLPWTVRQIHYNLVEKEIIPNILKGYRKISRVSSKGRYTGHLPWNKIIDDTRGAFKTADYDTIENGPKIKTIN